MTRAPAPAPARVATIQARPVVAKVKRRTKGFDLEGVAGAKKPRAVPPPYSAVVPRPRSPTPEPESPPTHPVRKRHKGASAAAVDRARKLRAKGLGRRVPAPGGADLRAGQRDAVPRAGQRPCERRQRVLGVGPGASVSKLI